MRFMKPIPQIMEAGEILVAYVIMPAVDRNAVLGKINKTLISAGSERMAVNFGRARWLDNVSR